jgi:hypothetical protein
MSRARATLGRLRAAGFTDPELAAIAHDNALPILAEPDSRAA